MSDKPATQTERIFHETKFVFLSCAKVSEASMVHTTVDISISEAWEHLRARLLQLFQKLVAVVIRDPA